MKIRTKVLLNFLLISLTVLSVSGIILDIYVEKTISRQFLNHLRSVASIQKTRVESIMDRKLERLSLVSSRTQLRISLNKYNTGKGIADQKRMNRILLDARSSISDFEDIYVMDLNGEIVASTDQTVIGTNKSRKEYFKEGLSEEHRVDLLFLDKNKKLKVYLAGPLYLNNNLIGVIAIRSGTDTLISLVRDYTGLGETGETILARQDKEGNAQFIMPTRFDPGAPLKRLVPKSYIKSPIIQALLKKEGVFKDAIDYNSEPSLAVSRYINKMDWGLVVKIHKTEVFDPITALREMMVIIILVSTIMIVFLFLWLSRSISLPIVNLAGTAREISEGNIFRKAVVESKDEVGYLAEKFNHMTEGIIAKTKELEEKIIECNVTEEKLKITTESLNKAQQISHLGSWEWDIVNGKMYFSDEMYRLFGWKPGEIDPDYKIYISRVHPEDVEKVKHLVEKSVNNNIPYENEHRIIRIDGQERIHYTKGEIERDKDGKPLCLREIVLDVTEQRQLEHTKNSLIRDMSHSLKTPISMIEEALIISGKEIESIDNENLKKTHRIASENLKKVSNDVNKMLEGFSLDLRKLAVKEEKKYEKSYSIEKAVKSAVNNVKYSIDEKNIKITLDIADNAREITIAERDLITLMDNVIDNAVKFTDNGSISIKSELAGEAVLLTIKDTGCGISSKHLNRVFEKFYKRHPAVEGTGLGLSICKEIVEMYNGEINVRSLGEGKGTTVTIKIS